MDVDMDQSGSDRLSWVAFERLIADCLRAMTDPADINRLDLTMMPKDYARAGVVRIESFSGGQSIKVDCVHAHFRGSIEEADGLARRIREVAEFDFEIDRPGQMSARGLGPVTVPMQALREFRILVMDT